jgi:hypothetical protein
MISSTGKTTSDDAGRADRVRELEAAQAASHQHLDNLFQLMLNRVIEGVL